MRTTAVIIILSCSSISFSQGSISEIDRVYQFRGGFALTEKDGLFGILNSELEIIIPNILTSINNYDLSPYYFDGICYGVIGDSTVYFDEKGVRSAAFADPDIYPPRVSGYYIDSLWVSGFGSYKGAGPIGSNVIPYDYTYIYKGLGDQIVAVKRIEKYGFDSEGNYDFLRKTKSLIYSSNGDTIIELDGYVFPFESANCYFNSNDSCCYVLDESFDIQMDRTIIEAKVFAEFAWVLTKQGWGLVDKEFNFILEPKYVEVVRNKDWSAVKKNGKYALINSNTTFISDFIYDGDWTDYLGSDTIISAYSNDSLHILNIDGVKLYPNR